MWERWTLKITGRRPARPASFRYELIARAGRCLARQDGRLLAWGFDGVGLRMVVEGAPRALGSARRGLTCGTVRVLRQTRPEARVIIARQIADDPNPAVVWAHLAPPEATTRGPLASPWSSHRDLLCFRAARFFDAEPLRRTVEARRIHADCGGGPLPEGWPPPEGEREDLGLLMRVAAAVLGVLPSDRRSFRLFVHLARARGWTNRCLARALVVTPRRVRQLAAAPEPRLPLALAALADPRLVVVP